MPNIIDSPLIRPGEHEDDLDEGFQPLHDDEDDDFDDADDTDDGDDAGDDDFDDDDGDDL